MPKRHDAAEKTAPLKPQTKPKTTAHIQQQRKHFSLNAFSMCSFFLKL